MEGAETLVFKRIKIHEQRNMYKAPLIKVLYFHARRRRERLWVNYIQAMYRNYLVILSSELLSEIFY